jgi:hypothetical protein
VGIGSSGANYPEIRLVILSKLRPAWTGFLSKIGNIAWAFFLVSLPITSFPFFPSGVGGETLVRPLAVYPLLLLILLVTLPRLLRRPTPMTFLPLLAFVLVCVASTSLSLLQGIEPTLGISQGSRLVRALATLGIGVAIFFTVVLWPESFADLRYSLRWLYTGFGLALFWGTLQAIYVVRFSLNWFDLLGRVHQYISIRPLFTNRISGLTYEPNWFAEQISFLLLPWLLGAVLSSYSVFKWRWRRITIEMFLLGWTVLLLPFTYSRAGLFILLVLIFIGVLFFRGQGKVSSTEKRGVWKVVAIRLMAGISTVLVLAGLIYFAGSKNPFFARLWEYWQNQPQTTYGTRLGGYIEYMGFGPRFLYWETAYRIYEDYPVLGIGLGNYAFYFSQYLPDQSLATMPEVLRLLVPEPDRDRLITTKNFPARILAETGFLGMATFIAFLLAVLGCSLYLFFSPGKETRYWSKAGILGLIAFTMVSFSFDSFAIPNMWVVFGLITAAAHVHYRRSSPIESAVIQTPSALPTNSQVEK